MTRRRRTRSAWLMIAALSLPAAPLLFAAQASDEAAADERPAARDRSTAERAADDADDEGDVVVTEEPVGEERTAAETEAADEPVPPPAPPRVKPSTSRPAVRPKPPVKPSGNRAATTSPTTRPTKDLSAEEMLSQMLKPQPPGGSTRPLSPLPEVASGAAPDKTSGPGAVAPTAPVVTVLREGTFLVDRVGRLGRGADGGQPEFVFESDGTALQDPPVVIIPNLKLMQIEDAAANSTRDLRFRISGMVTEYRGRNYVLLEKVVVVPEVLERF